MIASQRKQSNRATELKKEQKDFCNELSKWPISENINLAFSSSFHVQNENSSQLQ